MGRITVFVSDDNSDGQLLRGAFQHYSIPFEEINLDKHPGRRLDMINLTNNLTTPQVFFNEKYIGGARAVISLLKKYKQEAKKNSTYPSVNERIAMEVLREPISPTKAMLLRIPSGRFSKNDKLIQPFERTLIYDNLQIGKEIESTIGKVTRDLLKWLPRRSMNRFNKLLSCRKASGLSLDCKNYFSGREAINTFKKHYFLSTDAAIEFGQKLLQLGILHRVDNDEIVSNLFLKRGYFRLQSLSHSPEILNVFRVWKSESGYDYLYPDPKPFVTFAHLFRKISSIYKAATNNVGKIDYYAARKNAEFKNFEEAVCQLQLMKLDSMDEEAKKSFFINVYNLIIMHALVRLQQNKVSSSALSNFSYNIGGVVFSLDDIYHGILRSNSKHPKTNTKMFRKNDPRAAFSLRKKDPRVHFALDQMLENHTSPFLYHKETIEEELCVTAKVYCESNERIFVCANEVILPKFMSTYLSDFTSSGKTQDLLVGISKYLSKERCLFLNKMLEKGTVPVLFKSQSGESKLKWFNTSRRIQKHKHSEKDIHGKKEYPGLLEVGTSCTDLNSLDNSIESKSPVRYIALSRVQTSSVASNITSPTFDGANTYVSEFTLSDIPDDYSVDNNSITSKLNQLEKKLNRATLQEFDGKPNSRFEDIFNYSL